SVKGNNLDQAQSLADDLETALGPSSQNKVQTLLRRIESLTDAERLLLYTMLPAGKDEPPTVAPSARQRGFQWLNRSRVEKRDSDSAADSDARALVLLWAEQNLGAAFSSVAQLSRHLLQNPAAAQSSSRLQRMHCRQQQHPDATLIDEDDDDDEELEDELNDGFDGAFDDFGAGGANGSSDVTLMSPVFYSALDFTAAANGGPGSGSHLWQQRGVGGLRRPTDGCGESPPPTTGTGNSAEHSSNDQ
ncbi:hypothetical protein BOX15_Mlig028850g1, partial [Macrostomum lignano]